MMDVLSIAKNEIKQRLIKEKKKDSGTVQKTIYMLHYLRTTFRD